MKGIIEQAIPQFLIAALRDPHVLVKDTTAWTLSRIAEIHPEAIPVGCLELLVQNLLLALGAWALGCGWVCGGMGDWGVRSCGCR